MSGTPRPTTEATVDARTEGRLRALDRRSATTTQILSTLAVRGKHAWTAVTQIPAGGTLTAVTAWTAVGSDGAAELVGNGVFHLLQAGVWALTVTMNSGGSDAGNVAVVLRVGGVDKADGGYAGAGFPGAGYDYRHVSTAAPFGAADLVSDISVLGQWFSSGTAARAATYRLELNLLAGDSGATT